jgi:serine protease Do
LFQRVRKETLLILVILAGLALFGAVHRPATASNAPAAGFDWPAVRVAEMVTPSVVGIVTFAGTPDGPTLPRGAGSGIVYRPDGVVVTNDHVVAKASVIKVILPSGRVLPARLLGDDPLTDLAVLKVDADHLRPVTFAKGPAKVGELVVAIGSPMGPGFARTVTVGVVSGLNRYLGQGYAQRAFDLIQTDAAINPGNSGGPLVNAAGQVIGLNSVKVATPGFEGMGFAIPAATVQEVADAILRHGRMVRPWIGIAALGPDAARRLGIPLRRGLLIEEVYPGGPGHDAGLRPGDVILDVDGRPIGELTDLYRLLDRHRVGDELVLTVDRQGRTGTVRLRLEEMPSSAGEETVGP